MPFAFVSGAFPGWSRSRLIKSLAGSAKSEWLVSLSTRFGSWGGGGGGHSDFAEPAKDLIKRLLDQPGKAHADEREWHAGYRVSSEAPCPGSCDLTGQPGTGDPPTPNRDGAADTARQIGGDPSPSESSGTFTPAGLRGHPDQVEAGRCRRPRLRIAPASNVGHVRRIFPLSSLGR